MKRITVLFFLCINSVLKAQDYHAIQGSNYAGALGVHNNPASIVNTPYPWDVTIIGVQAKYQTNAVRILDYSLLSSPAKSKFMIKGGQFSRNGNEQLNVNLLNARIALKRKRSIAFGANFKSFGNAETSEYNYIDSITSINSFLSLNTGAEAFGGNLRSSSLLEFYLTYGQTILENNNYRLNTGLTLKINRGLAGAYADVNEINHTTTVVNGEPVYSVEGGNFAYGYSSNFDRWKDNKSSSQNLTDFLGATRTGFSFDAGFELLIKPAGEPGYLADEETYYDYDWKISGSLLDIGWGQYRNGVESRKGTIPQQGFSGEVLDLKFDSTISGLSEFNDSLGTIVPFEKQELDYRIFSPMRLVLNVDHYLFNAWYVNAELSLNIASLTGKSRLYLKNMNLFRVTPRWETRRWGIYLPMQFNTRSQFWVGAGFKAGPLLLGFHNLGNIFSKNKMANGGGYLALTIRPGKLVTSSTRGKTLDCPPY